MVSIRDVARVVGVSTATVSRVINGRTGVGDAVRSRVLAAAEKLRYVPDSAARKLITGRTNTVGVLLPDLHGEFFSELVRGVDLAARRHGLQILLTATHGSALEARQAIRAMRGQVDALLIMSRHVDAKFLREHLEERTPVALLCARTRYGGVTHVGIDNSLGAIAMVEHLVRLGHRRIAFIAGLEENADAAERLQGYRRSLARLLPSQRPIVLAGRFTEESGFAAGQRLALLDPRPEAVFAANDAMAVGCLRALREAGLRVPQDVALAGFDDLPVAQLIEPALTTVRVPVRSLGEDALEQLALGLRRPERERLTRRLSVSLIVRSSCGAREWSVQPCARRAPARPRNPSTTRRRAAAPSG
jgi:LacI family transcriptional regulator